MATGATRSSAPPIGLTHLLLFLGLAAVSFPTLYSLMQQSWTTESGMHGPITLATGIWLLVRRRKELETIAKPGSSAITAAMLLLFAPAYVFGRAFDFLSVEVAALLGMIATAAYAYLGLAALRRIWFALIYLAFLIPLPGWLIDQVTAPLKTFVSSVSTGLLELAGYPVIREGVTIWINQYQLLVEDACAGLNSLISLTAISLFYIYILHNASWRYALFLTLWIVPMAIIANIVRIIILVLITHYFGDSAAQGFLHSTAGLVMFAIAVLGIFLIDALFQRLLSRRLA